MSSDKPTYPIMVPSADANVLTNAKITFLTYEHEEDQNELCIIYWQVSDVDTQQRIIRRLNPNFENSRSLILRIVIDKHSRITSGIAFNRLRLIADYKVRYAHYQAVFRHCPHDLIRRAAGKAAERVATNFGNVISLDSRR